MLNKKANQLKWQRDSSSSFSTAPSPTPYPATPHSADHKLRSSSSRKEAALEANHAAGIERSKKEKKGTIIEEEQQQWLPGAGRGVKRSSKKYKRSVKWGKELGALLATSLEWTLHCNSS